MMTHDESNHSLAQQLKNVPLGWFASPSGDDSEALTVRQSAYLGDGVYELLVRQVACKAVADNTKAFHQWSVQRVCATYQAAILQHLQPHLTEDELDWARRGRNLPIPKQRTSQQKEYRAATSFEALVGYWFIHKPDRLTLLLPYISQLQPTLGDAND
jgi:ribonuclease-3 family protein